MSITALVVDDHAEFRCVATVLLVATGYAVAGDADSAETAVAAARRLCPDVIVLDVQLPDYGVRLRDSAARGFLHKPDLSKHSLRACLERSTDIG